MKNEIAVCPLCQCKYQIPDKDVDRNNQDDSYLVFGKLAVKYKFVSAEQLQEALSIQKQRKRVGENLFLGEIMGLLGMISQSQLSSLLLAQKIL